METRYTNATKPYVTCRKPLCYCNLPEAGPHTHDACKGRCSACSFSDLNCLDISKYDRWKARIIARHLICIPQARVAHEHDDAAMAMCEQ